MQTVLSSLNSALSRLLQDDPRVFLLGEDILDPYGGAFKVTRGLSSQFPNRVLSTPISEGAMVGLAAGMALRGIRPVVEIMFGDFITLAADQLINHAAKFHGMYNGQVSAPVIVRTPMGGRRGYGPTHSQTLEKLFLGIPGLRVLAPAALGDPGDLLYQAVRYGSDPTLFVENKLLYLTSIQTLSESNPDIDLTASGTPDTPTYRLSIRGAPPATLTLVAYGYSAWLAQQALHRLAFEAEIFAELIVPTSLAPLNIAPINTSLTTTHRLLVVEEGPKNFGWGAELLARCLETPDITLLRAGRCGAADFPIPASPVLEESVLPGIEDIFQIAKKMV